ncbi:putative pyruvate dehydrogenase E1 component subunit alpha-3, chloroplastic-like [Capsicum annuum]|nr:putative pyruvate dehydrogenase E1 component subunit alpha-3, chloroplastic-like [Capsicum annuum]
MKGKNGIVIDVGANVGMASFAAAVMGFKVLAFEPVFENLQKICEGIYFNRVGELVEVYEAAVSDHNGNITFHKLVGRLDNSAVSATGAKLAFKSNEEIEVQVKTIPLDEVIQETERVLLIKIDVQGWEYHVLKGASKILSRKKGEAPYLIYEEDERLLQASNSSTKEIREFLRSVGYNRCTQHGKSRHVWAVKAFLQQYNQLGDLKPGTELTSFEPGRDPVELVEVGGGKYPVELVEGSGGISRGLRWQVSRGISQGLIHGNGNSGARKIQWIKDVSYSSKSNLSVVEVKATDSDKDTKVRSIVCQNCDGSELSVSYTLYRSQVQWRAHNVKELGLTRSIISTDGLKPVDYVGCAGKICIHSIPGPHLWDYTGGKKDMLCGECNGAGFLGGFLTCAKEEANQSELRQGGEAKERFSSLLVRQQYSKSTATPPPPPTVP